MRFAVGFVLLAVLCAMQNVASAQSVSKKTQNSNVQSWTPSSAQFADSDRLTPLYKGTSAAAVISWIDANIPTKKGEYEKQDDFIARRANIATQFAGKTFAFRWNDSGFVYEKYDADFEAYVAKSSALGDPALLAVERTVQQGGKREFANALGARVIVDMVDSETSAIQIPKVFLEKSGLFTSFGVDKLMLKILKFPIESARTIKARDISFLFFGEIDPFVNSEVLCSEPTISSPTAGCYRTRYFQLKPRKVIVYHQITGRVLYEKILDE